MTTLRYYWFDNGIQANVAVEAVVRIIMAAHSRSSSSSSGHDLVVGVAHFF